MTARIRAHLRSNIVGYIALFCFAIGGTAEALPGTNKVDSGDIKNHQVKRKDLANNSVSGANVVDGSLSEADISPAALKAIFATGAVTSVQLADGTILTSDLADGSVTTPKLAEQAVTTPKLADGSATTVKIASDAVDSGKVADDSLTGDDLAGADLNEGAMSIPAGYVPNGRCRQLDATVGGAEAGQAVLFSIQAALQDGVMIYGQGVPSNDHVMFDVCNFSGTTQVVITDMPVHVLTFE